MNALIIAEYTQQQLTTATLAAIDAAHYVADQITLLIIGSHCTAIVQQAINCKYVTTVLILEHHNYQNLLAEKISEIVLKIINNKIPDHYQYIMVGATLFGKNLLPRICACLNVEQGSEITKIITHDTFTRSIYAGNAYQTIQLLSEPKCLTIRTVSFQHSYQTNTVPASVITLDHKQFLITNTKNIWEEKIVQPNFTNSLDLTSAKIVVAGGGALATIENFQLIYALAKQLNAAVGASKTAVDLGLAPINCQIGQTGKLIAPQLYIAIGIAGAIQHLAGIRDSKVIVAINNDHNAPILEVAHYAIIGDLFIVVPELINKLKVINQNLTNQTDLIQELTIN